MSISWNGQTFSQALKLQSRSASRKRVVFDYPGVDGVEVSDFGWRGCVLQYYVQIQADTLTLLDAAVSALEDLVQVGTATFTETAAYDNVELSAMQVLSRRRTHAGKVVAECVLTFTQLRG
jgi:hypothetical protein